MKYILENMKALDSKKIKIARVATIPFTFISLTHLLGELSNDNRFEVHLITWEDDFLPVLQEKFPNLKYHKVKISRNISLRDDFFALFSLIKIFVKENFDIVHSHTPKAGLLTAIAGKITLRKNIIHTFTGQIWANYKGIKRIFYIYLDKIISKLCTNVYVDSVSQKKFLLQSGIGTDKHLNVLHKGSFAGIDLQKFSKEKNKDKALLLRRRLFPEFEGNVLLYLGRLNNDKGLLELGEAFLVLKEKYNLKLLIVGPEDKLDEKNLKMIGTLKNEKNVFFESFTLNPEIYLTLADIYCLPSYREGCPTTIIEASACETIVIGSDIYGIKDTVEDGKTGYLFKCKDSQDLANKIEMVLTRPETRLEMEKNGRNFVEKNFDQKILTRLMIKEYSDMLSR